MNHYLKIPNHTNKARIYSQLFSSFSKEKKVEKFLYLPSSVLNSKYSHSDLAFPFSEESVVIIGPGFDASKLSKRIKIANWTIAKTLQSFQKDEKPKIDFYYIYKDSFYPMLFFMFNQNITHRTKRDPMTYISQKPNRSEIARRAVITRKINVLQKQWDEASSAGKRTAIKRVMNNLIRGRSESSR